MKHHFLILALLITFQANAIAGAIMMSDMVAMSSSHEKHTSIMHDESCSTTMSMHHVDACDSKAKAHCDEYGECGVCSGHYFKAMLAHSFDISPTCRFDSESDYRFSGVTVTHPLTLKPPKLI